MRLSSHKWQLGLARSFWAAAVTRRYLPVGIRVLRVNLSLLETSRDGFIPDQALGFVGDAEINNFCLRGTYNEVVELRPLVAT